jgi:hypothetical protein
VTDQQLKVSEEPPPQTATQDSPTLQAKPKRPKREPLLTLCEFYGTKNASPARFLNDLRNGNVWEFNPDDVEAALRLLDEGDPKFSRTTALAVAAVSEKDGRFARTTLAFVQEATHARLARNPRWARGESEVDGSSEDRFRSLVRSQAERLAAAKKRPEALNLLLASALHMVYAERLPTEVVIVELADALDEHPRLTADADLARVAHLVAAGKTGASELRLQLQLALPWINAARKARASAEDEAARARLLDANLDTSEQELDLTTRRLTDTARNLQAAQAEIQALKADLVAAQHHNAHDLRETRGRVAGALNGRLVDLVATIKDALEVEPPRLAVAREKVEIAQDELERQLEWLRSSD